MIVYTMMAAMILWKICADMPTKRRNALDIISDRPLAGISGAFVVAHGESLLR